MQKSTFRLALLMLVALIRASEAAKSVCYGDLGCFTNGAPFSELPLPEDPAKIYPTFYLYRGSNPAQVISDSLSLNTNDLVVLIHGLGETYDNSTKSWQYIIARKLIEVRHGVDVVFVDWGKGASFGWGLDIYEQPASNTRVIGAIVAQFLEKNAAFDASKAYCIGFSLGSHVCGFAGKSMTRKWGRITGLDPANPNFDKTDPTARLDKTDADFVDVMHVSWLGLQMPVGHVDFWINGADKQPGCASRRRRNLVMDAVFGFFGCSHFRGPELYVETIAPPTNCSFTFCPCPSMSDWNKGKCDTCEKAFSQQLGYPSINYPTRGEFYGKTTNLAPFCLKT